MKTLVPLPIFVIVVGGLLLLSSRARRRQASASAQRAEQLTVGSEVMTTSGLYGTVVARNEDDDTVLLAIAPGVEVKWAVAALRDIASLPAQYQGGAGVGTDPRDDPDQPPPRETGGPAPGVDLDKPQQGRGDEADPDAGP